MKIKEFTTTLIELLSDGLKTLKNIDRTLAEIKQLKEFEVKKAGLNKLPPKVKIDKMLNEDLVNAKRGNKKVKK